MVVLEELGGHLLALEGDEENAQWLLEDFLFVLGDGDD